jgi:ABC-2 type transport system ATP-binding protein
MASRTVIASLTDVTKRFRGLTALDTVSIALHRGEALALLGPNGAGKTTALSLLTGLRRPDAGEVRLFGRDPRDPDARLRLGVTPQASGFPPTLRVEEVVRLVATHFPDPLPTGALLDQFGLAPIRRRQAGGLSGGEARRLSVALAFVGRPEVVFLDEPTGQLDIEVRRAVWDAIRGYVAAGGTALLTSHHLEEVEALASQVVVLARGRIVARDTIAGIREIAGLTRIRLTSIPPTGLPGVLRSEHDASGVALYARDTALVVRSLVAAGASLHGLEVRPASLEEAFLELTRHA